jgi:hypothetical protein
MVNTKRFILQGKLLKDTKGDLMAVSSKSDSM